MTFVPPISAMLPSASLVLAALVAFSAQSTVSAAREDLRQAYELWNSVVSKYVQPGTLENISVNVVDYEGISKDANFTAYIDAIAKANTTGLNRNETYGFFMNVYNALAIKMIIDHPCYKSLFSSCRPIKSIKEIGSLLHPVWDMPAGVVGGKEVTLNDVENFLRDPKPFKEDSRLHMCIVCASISCPNVRREAYQSKMIGEQMDSQVRDFLTNSKKGYYLDRSSNKLHLSSIFLWFSGDFDAYGGVVAFISPYIPSADAMYISEHNPSKEYFDYNWDVNGKPPCQC